MKWLFICLCQLNLCTVCALPSANSPISVCAFCLDNHAGVKWMVHRSHDDRHFFDSKRIDTINIDFQCQDPQGSVIDHDDCFDGSRLPFISSISTGEWRWYILERNLSQGTECSFTTTLFNHWYLLKQTLDITTCTVGDCSKADDCLTSPPAVCTGGEPGDSTCSCSCSDGFSGSVGRAGGLLCRNIDECASGAHRCGHIDNCIDNEGGHECLHEPNITSTTTSDSSSADVPITTTSISTDHLLPTTTCTPVQVDVTTTTTTRPDTIPMSVHAFCSNKHAGVKWMMHESNMNRDILDPETIDIVDIKFQCQAPEGNVISSDDCFNGFYLPFVSTVKAGEWRWYILEREMSEGTECNFTTTVQNTFLGVRKTLDTSTCSVKSSLECSEAGNCLIPAVCTGGEPGDSVCSCSCSDGFSGSVSSQAGLLCRNIDECTLGMHHCGDVGNCVDTEGGYDCFSKSTVGPATIASVSTAGNNGAMTPSTNTETTITASANTVQSASMSTTVPASGSPLSNTESVRDVLQP